MEKKIAWLQGLMDGEGCVGLKPPQVVIGVQDKDSELLNKAKQIYDKLGIEYKEYLMPSTYKYKNNHRLQMQKRLVIHKQSEIIKFSKLVGFTLSRQKIKLEQVINSFQNGRKITRRKLANYDIIKKIST